MTVRPTTPPTFGRPPARSPSPWVYSWYFVVTLVSFGTLAWIPFLHAATRLHRRWLLVLTFVYAPLGALEGILIMLTPDEQSAAADTTATISGLLIMWLIISGLAVQAFLVRELHLADERAVHAADSPATSAVAVAMAARTRRTEARRMAEADPLLARDLRIGRPDLPRSFDDGGLVDLNSAPAPLIAQLCGLSGDVAGTIVAAREQCGGFLTVDDVLSMTDIPVTSWDVVRDRGIVIRLLP